jgi:Fe-S oxidoreductase
MPQYESGKVLDVAKRAAKILPELDRWVSHGYDVVSVVPSCTFMLKQQYPLLLPDDAVRPRACLPQSANICPQAAKRVASKTFDISEYVVYLNQKEVFFLPLTSLNLLGFGSRLQTAQGTYHPAARLSRSLAEHGLQGLL